MTIEQIQKFLDSNKKQDNEYVMITFKRRDPLFGLFLKSNEDYKELKSKNFWRIVPRKSFDDYNVSENIAFSRIFAGSDFIKLTAYSEAFEQ